MRAWPMRAFSFTNSQICSLIIKYASHGISGNLSIFFFFLILFDSYFNDAMSMKSFVNILYNFFLLVSCVQKKFLCEICSRVPKMNLEIFVYFFYSCGIFVIFERIVRRAINSEPETLYSHTRLLYRENKFSPHPGLVLFLVLASWLQVAIVSQIWGIIVETLFSPAAPAI